MLFFQYLHNFSEIKRDVCFGLSYDFKLHFTDANARCLYHGGKLPMVTNQHENDEIQALLTRYHSHRVIFILKWSPNRFPP